MNVRNFRRGNATFLKDIHSFFFEKYTHFLQM